MHINYEIPDKLFPECLITSSYLLIENSQMKCQRLQHIIIIYIANSAVYNIRAEIVPLSYN